MQFSDLAFPDSQPFDNSCIALLGGGGKTGLQHRLGQELALSFNRILLTSLTKSAWHADPPIHCLDDLPDHNLQPLFKQQNPLCLMGSCLTPEKLTGISAAELDELRHKADSTIVECDGARNRPLKAHLPHDPMIPDYFDRVIVIVGADVTGTTLTDGLVHRPDVFKHLWQINEDFVLFPEFIARVVTQGYAGKIPAGMPRSYFVNKSDTHNNAKELAQAINKISKAPTWFGSVQQDLLERIR